MADALKERENLYKLMISQLRYDGFEAIASTLAKVVNIISACPPMARLHQLVNLGLQAETEGVKPEPTTIPGLTPPVETGRGIDLEYEPEGNDMNRERQTYSADESFMSNLELQKVAQESENEPQEMEDDLPSASDVLHHIRRISSGKKTLRLIQHMNVTPPVKPAALIDDIPDTESIVDQVKIELVKYNVSQEVFAKAVLGKSQGYLSEMLKHGENMFSPSEQTHCRGWQNFETMRQFMTKPEAERLRIYFQKGEELKMERLKRRQMETECPGDDPSKKKRRFIPTEAKAVMEECYSRNRYLTTEKRQMLAKSLAIPEQCVSDFFKNLRSRKKHEARMKFLLKDLEYSNQQYENVALQGSNGFGGVSKPQVLSCSSQGRSDLHISVAPTPCKSESLSQSGVMDSLERHCAATSKASSFTSHGSLGNDIRKIDIVASKIAALSQSQQMQHKQPTRSITETSSSCKTSGSDCQRITTHMTASHFAAQDTGRLVSSPSSVETFSFESLPVIDSSCGSVVLQGGTPGTEGLEVGQQIYVVHVNNTVDSSISD